MTLTTISAPLQGFLQAVGRRNDFGNRTAGEKEFIHVASVDAVADFGLVRPEMYVVSAAASEDDGDGGAPGACTDDGNPAQVAPDSPPPKSVFVAGEQAANVVFVTNDDEQGRGGDEQHDRGTAGFRIRATKRLAGKMTAPRMLPSDT